MFSDFPTFVSMLTSLLIKRNAGKVLRGYGLLKDFSLWNYFYVYINKYHAEKKLYYKYSGLCLRHYWHSTSLLNHHWLKV